VACELLDATIRAPSETGIVVTTEVIAVTLDRSSQPGYSPPTPARPGVRSAVIGS